MIKKILVPVDGSEYSDRAVDLAGDLAAKYGAEVVLLQVLLRGHVPDRIRRLSSKEGKEQPPLSAGAGFVEAALPHEVLVDIAEKLLQAARERAEARGAEKVETTWDLGDPARVILAHAERRDADAIVMGSRGLGDLKGLLMGSVSQKVQHLFPGIVVTVK